MHLPGDASKAVIGEGRVEISGVCFQEGVDEPVEVLLVEERRPHAAKCFFSLPYRISLSAVRS